MRTSKLADMTRGWFVGDFEPSIIRSRDMEVACQQFRAGDVEARHVHKIATEVTVVVSGEVEFNGRRFTTGDIVVLEPGEPTDFRSISDSTTLVVKSPSVIGDKHPA